MRRNIVHPGADELIYEIRQIVGVGKHLEKLGVKITWENIGDPVQKGEKIAPFIKKIVSDLVQNDLSWAYTATQGYEKTRNFLAEKVNERGGTQITPDDIVFFNGLGDAVAKIFGFMRREARILGPSPAYSTYSSAEAAHSGYEHLTYELNPDNGWMPDINDIENKVRYNDSIAGILLINPDNPTGAVYDREIIKKIVQICEKYNCILICDETYAHVNYSGSGSIHLSECIGDKACGMALRSISKELPWPGSRCGWIEVFNRKNDPLFDRYIKSLVDAKMLEVCSTTLPQMAIPDIYSSPEFIPHLNARNEKYRQRAHQAVEILSQVKGIKVVEPKGGFFLTVLFETGILNDRMKLKISNSEAEKYISGMLANAANDRRFVLNLLASTGICVVPISSFCCRKDGFRVTLLEEDPEAFEKTFRTIADSISDYLKSA
ncbi:MAG TPA: pyridoxal phosphate-dependent aminotransferase [Leptospiraceae bacterium]|nr:pyridoxal phosphate-dependent aminotransferase [Leptospiraceae bacterium]HNF23145.1 pyridoxal phosphate-dependent aminotransferase [Leptospiraceae bacterium]HNI96799.1 pyridoxal phosphate-dependent aminotransferase [Leptospiraceae bacterium]HNM04130.1 pyridoxal phosphate-dependent aminotransferase [Leptospiraceae bacterium]HNN04545.1 pyridoxal phosphate-dependent aminotransferase [Leptospiraceae bacterium]